ncbi:MAG: leucine--tRNA ligase [Candidatus Micrarchaeota archaeon]|nr:leucine--tRNA ligase [Candidatus Micrarchaeota archaeon]
MIDYKGIEAKWQSEWDKAHLFEGNVSDRESFFITVAFPYPNAPQHIGHLRAYGTGDVIARYKRMKGLNVLFPMAFHGTGTPILAFAKRLKNNDADLINELKMFHVPEEELKKMTDPLYIANYFVAEIENGMRRAGYSIDWRRKFTSIEPFFSKFIEWQFKMLDDRRLLVKGRHPVGWCPNENNAVGMHDTKHDVEPEIEKQIAIKFKVDGEESYMACTTYRPETVFGVTNLFINKEASYAQYKVDGEVLYLSKAAAEILKYQMGVEYIKDVPPQEMLQKRCIGISGNAISVLPGFFVNKEMGTGIVMSVPAHAPFDYSAIERLKNEGQATGITPIKVLDIPGKGYPIPSLAYLKIAQTDANGSFEDIEKATKLEYKEESHMGRMAIKGYEGLSENEARERITAELLGKKQAIEMYILVNLPVYCRCGYGVVVKVVDNQWFINYGDKEWKEKTKRAFSNIKILPVKSRKAFESAIDWIDLRAVARAQGLGTKFPLDNNYIIESLSDSTIYMAFYTISNIIRGINPENLKPEFFSYVFLNSGDSESVSKSTGIDYETIKRCRESFDYWYVNTSRHSGVDLIFNHLTMYIYNHVAILEERRWPKQIVVNGSVLSEGEKMSKSLGNIVPLIDGIEKYGADLIRFVVVAGADLFSDSEFSADAVKGVDERMNFIYDTARQLESMESSELSHIDYWLYSKLNRKIRSASESIEELELRAYATTVLYDSAIELRSYFNRNGSNGIVVRDYVSAVSLLLSPITPHVSEELWHILGNSSFASVEKWPAPNPEMISDKIESEELMLDSIINDSKAIVELMKRKHGSHPRSVKFIVAAKWKGPVTNIVAGSKKISAAVDAIKKGMEDFKDLDKEKAMAYATGLGKKVNSLQKTEVTQDDEYRMLSESSGYLSSMLNCDVSVEREEDSKSARANGAMPGRPAIEAVF